MTAPTTPSGPPRRLVRDLFDLSGRVAVVTGSGRGLGAAISCGLADAGAIVVTCSRTATEAEQVAEQIRADGGTAIGTSVDVKDRASCEALMELAVSTYGRLDVLVNNAGIDIITPAEEVTDDAWREILDINLGGYFLCSQVAGRRMLEQGSGSIVNNSSIAATAGIAGLTAYAAAKGGVNQLTKVMAMEWAQRGVRVNAFAPGYFENIMRGATGEHGRAEKQQQVLTFTPMGRRGLPDELIGPVVFLASDASSYVTGAVLAVDGGYTAI
jgi:NAD(P)-dependent dehydrogenase (short-subunit alcohol dehydrogenase family)